MEFIDNPAINRYLCMINDKWRNQFFYDALHKHAKDKIVLDVGTGTGLLAFYALSAGAKFVYCVERLYDAAELTDQILSKLFDRSRFKVLRCDFWTNEIDNLIDDKIDILVSETVGPGLYDQGMFHTWNYAKPFLSESAISIPDRLHSDIWLWSGEDNLDNVAPKAKRNLDINTINQFNRNAYFNINDYSLDELYVSAVIDKNYAQALIEVDREWYNKNKQKTVPPVRWELINRIREEPSEKRLDILSYTLDQGPELEYTTKNYPEHIIPKISFDLDVPDKSVVAFVHKMSFESETLYLKDASYMPWKKSPMLFIPAAGQYTFTYNNSMMGFLSLKEWIYEAK